MFVLKQKAHHQFAKILAAVATTILWTATSQADVIYFSDNFNYSNGNLAGNGTATGGWAGAWSGGTSQVANPLSGTVEKSVTISKDATVTTRQISGTYATGGTSYYLSFLFNANPFQAGGSGKYAGISLTDGSASLFIGMPGDSGQYGFDWRGENQLTSSASSGQTYLTLVEIKAGSSSNTIVNMYATTDLLMSGNSLLTNGTLIASAEGSNFSFSSVEIAGGYTSGTISLAALAMADSANAAVNFTRAAVPEPGTLFLGSIASLLGGGAIWRKRQMRHRHSPPVPLPQKTV
jgi:hypothetical protein